METIKKVCSVMFYDGYSNNPNYVLFGNFTERYIAYEALMKKYELDDVDFIKIIQGKDNYYKLQVIETILNDISEVEININNI